MDKPSVEQQVCGDMAITFVVRKNWSHTLSVNGSYGRLAGWLAVRQNVGEFQIETHDSELRGQEEAAIIRETKITEPLSELFTRKTAKKIANALAKLP